MIRRRYQTESTSDPELFLGVFDPATSFDIGIVDDVINLGCSDVGCAYEQWKVGG